MARIEVRKNASDEEYVSAIHCSEEEASELLAYWQQLYPTHHVALINEATPIGDAALAAVTPDPSEGI